MSEDTMPSGYHRLLTTNWDHLLQQEVDAWIAQHKPGWAPRFLGNSSMVLHLNGSIEPGLFQNRSPFLLESDDARQRTKSYEANKAFNGLLWSTLVVIIGMSFECDIDKGLLGALRGVEDDLPIGSAGFVVVEPCKMTLDTTLAKLAACFPRAYGFPVNMGLDEWITAGMPELVGRIFRPAHLDTDICLAQA